MAPDMIKNLPELLPFLRGERFSTGCAVKVEKRPVRRRDEFILELAAGRRVIHLGCADHRETIDAKIARGEWLHEQLAGVTARLLGFDINAAAIEYLRRQHGRNDVFEADIAAVPEPRIMAETWDHIIIGEVLEHVANPQSFLARIRAFYGPLIQRAIITVPNAYGLGRIIRVVGRREVINSDHYFYFTPYTFLRLLIAAGLEPLRLEGCSLLRTTRIPFKNLIASLNPLLADVLVAVCRLTPGADEG